jgi:hypothetical protein
MPPSRRLRSSETTSLLYTPAAGSRYESTWAPGVAARPSPMAATSTPMSLSWVERSGAEKRAAPPVRLDAATSAIW